MFARLIYFILELDSLTLVVHRFLCPSLTSPPPNTSRLQKKRDSWNDRFRSKPGGLQLSERTCQDFKRTKSSLSIAGLVFTFSFPWRFKLTTLAVSISRMIF